MNKKHLQPLTPAAFYARVSSDRQDVDLSVSAQLRALKDYARANGYSVARQYVDEAESGRVADRPQFREMIEEGSKPNAPFEVILVWKFSRFTRKREHAVAFKSMLRRKGIRVVSITEHADDSPTGKLMEAIIESVDEFYSENLAEDVTRGMREAASRGFFLGSKAPFGYRRVKVSDGMKERPTLEVDPATAPVVKEIFESSLSGYGLKEICRTLNDRGITNRGKRWYKGGLHYLLTNEAYTGTAVWGRTTKVEKAQDPVRVEGAWPALVSRELFDAVQQAMRDRAPKVQRPGRVGSKFLLSGLLKCGVCGRPYSGQGAKSGQFGYYVCGTLFREGAGTCSARYLNAPRVEDFIVEKIRERILTEETIVELVTMVAEEIDAMAGELSGRLEVIDAELRDVRKRLERLYEALETSELTLEVLSPRIFSLRHREEQLEAAREDAETQREQRRVELPTTEEIKGYVADFREFLQEGTFPERKALIRNFVEGIEVVGDEATLTYTVPMPKDGVKRESASVLDFVQSGPPTWTVHRPSSAPSRCRRPARFISASGSDPDNALPMLKRPGAVRRGVLLRGCMSAARCGHAALNVDADLDHNPTAVDTTSLRVRRRAPGPREGQMVAAGYPRTTLAAGAMHASISALDTFTDRDRGFWRGACLASGDHRPGGRRQRPRWRLRDSPLRPRRRLRDRHRFGLWFRLRDSPRYLLRGRQRGGSGTRGQAARSDAAACGCLRRSRTDVRPRASSDLLGRRRAASRSPPLAAGCSGTLARR